MNMLLGIQSCSSMHPCPYCNGYKFDKMGKKTNQKGLWLKGEPRTMKSLLEDYRKWALETSSNRKMLKEYFNVEYPPIYIPEGQENMEVWSIYQPPHFHTGILGSINNVFEQN